MSIPLPQTTLVTTPRGDVEVADTGTGPVVVALHGTPGGFDQGAIMGRFLVDAGYRVIAPSRPGYLRTALTGRTATIDQQAALLVALLNALDLDQVHVFGWSGGGPAAYRLAVLYPERVHALVTLAAVSRSYTWDEPAMERLLFSTRVGTWLIDRMAEKAPRQIVVGTIQACGTFDKDTINGLADHVMSDPAKLDFVLKLTNSAYQTKPRRAGTDNDLRQFEAIHDLQFERITVPTLVVHGDSDKELDCADGRYAADRIPGAQLMLVPGGSHTCLFTDPDSEKQQQQVLDFLASAVGAR